jgi:cardiolipin synthase
MESLRKQPTIRKIEVILSDDNYHHGHHLHHVNYAMDLDSISAGYTAHNRVQLVRGGADYFNVAEALIDQAVHSIHFQTYIFEHDQTGQRVADALVRAAFRNVRVYLMLDGYASADLDPAFVQRWRESGIHFRWFQPIVKGKDFYLGRRMHHKILVVDGLHSLVGGVNVSNRYNDLPGQPAWLDFAIRIDGEASIELYNRCVEMWTKTLWKKIGLPGLFNWRSILAFDEQANTRIRINDWVRNKNQISRSYLEMFHRANDQITILSSYFMPGRILRKQIDQAARRGVVIRVILTSRSDVHLSKSAERYLYPWLLNRNVEIYEYRHTVLHGKMATYDRQWATIGSYNVNNISAYASIELNVDVHNTAFATSVERALERIIQDDCIRISRSRFSTGTNLFLRFKRRVSYEMIRVILYLFTFYFRQEARGR